MIGIGQNNKISSINIFWPKSCENQVLNDLGINRWHYIIEPSSYLSFIHQGYLIHLSSYSQSHGLVLKSILD